MTAPTRRALLLAAPAALAAGGARAQDDAPTAVVERLHTTLLDAMRAAAGGLGTPGRAARLRPVLERSFDLPAMSRIAVGPSWTGFAPAQQAAVSTAFADWTVATYASRFNGYSGESFDTLGEAAAPNGEDRLVRTRINRTGGEAPVALNYLVRRGSAGWRIVDVFLSGTISEIASRRSEFTAILRDGGPDRLAAELRSRADGLLRG